MTDEQKGVLYMNEERADRGTLDALVRKHWRGRKGESV